MDVIERRLAEQNMKHNEMMQSSPIYASLHKHAHKRATEEARRNQILDSYGLYGYILPEGKEEPRKPTDEELLMQEILKNY